MAALLFWENRNDSPESREGFCRRGRGRSFDVERPKTEKAREPTVKSLVRDLEAESINNKNRTKQPLTFTCRFVMGLCF